VRLSSHCSNGEDKIGCPRKGSGLQSLWWLGKDTMQFNHYEDGTIKRVKTSEFFHGYKKGNQC
jgi:hypothetical protein